MNFPRLPLLVLAAPFLLSACGSSPDEPVPTQQTSSARSSSRAAAVVAPPATTVMSGSRTNFSFARTAVGYDVTDLRSGTVLKVPAGARLRFDDVSVALDIDGIPGKAFRLYRAAFGRMPDIAGLSYWIKAMDAGAPFESVAAGFVKAAEFKALFGDKPGNVALVERMYRNVLGRDGETAGLAYWSVLLDQGRVTTAELLGAFSESAELKASTSIAQHGIAYHEEGYFYGTLGPDEFRYKTEAPLTSVTEARQRWNYLGFRGYAWSRRIGSNFSGRSDWHLELYAMAKPRAKYYYEVRASGTNAERMALFEELGAKGYLYKSTRTFSDTYWQPYDIFVKSSERDANYRYQFKPEHYTTPSLNEQGALGYAYLDLLDPNTTIYVKNTKSDAVFDYVQTGTSDLGRGGMEELNDMGAQSYAFLGNKLVNYKWVSLFMRSSAHRGTYSYVSEFALENSAEEAAPSLLAHALKGEAFHGNYFQAVAPIGTRSVYSKGAWINQPGVGVTFP